MTRNRIYEIIEKAEGQDRLSAIYDYAMIAVIVISLIPLAFKKETPLFFAIDKASVSVFIVDYLLRWTTADYKYQKKSASSFVRYPFSPMAIVDLKGTASLEIRGLGQYGMTKKVTFKIYQKSASNWLNRLLKLFD